MLINDFFELLEQKVSDEKIIAKIKLNPSHRIFGGHFPNNPITPGVIQIQIVKEIMEAVHKKDLRLLTLSRCKFLKILNPNETPLLVIDISIVGSPLHISAMGMEGEHIYFKLSATFSDAALPN